MDLSIYFAASIRSGRDDAELYAEILELLRQFGTVLSEHVCDQSLTTRDGSGQDVSDIYHQDMTFLKRAGLVVAEVTIPSTGVGFEIAFAQFVRQIPVICLYRPMPDRTLSAMIAGNPQIQVIEYQTISDLRSALPTIMNSIWRVTL